MGSSQAPSSLIGSDNARGGDAAGAPSRARLTLRTLAMAAGLALAALAWPAGAAAGPSVVQPQYPDVRTLPPSQLRLWQTTVNGDVRHEIRFTTVFANLGQGTLELHGTPHIPLDGRFDATQRIYLFPAGFRDEPVGTFAYHPEHSHFHLDDFTRYELWTRSQFDRAQETGFARGRPLGVRDKVSFCLYDARRVDTTSPTVSPVAVFNVCSPILEGISVGWADVYDWGLASQSIDVGTSPLPDGHYVIRTIADPANRIWESDGRSDPSRDSDLANQGYTYFTVENGALVAG